MERIHRSTETRCDLIIGTRGSKYALAQARIALARIRRVAPNMIVDMKVITTSGDRDQRSSLSAIGRRGAFIREIENALLAGTIDVAVHSFKDVTAQLAEGARLSAFFKPESVCDALALRAGLTLETLPRGSRIGTGSMRRRALLLRLRPDLLITEIRGNIDTRLLKLEQGHYDGIMLSEAGLLRLGLEKFIAARFSPHVFYPAPGQGVITLQTRAADKFSHALCVLAGDEEQRIKSHAELGLLRTIGFDCRSPLGVYTEFGMNKVCMKGFIEKCPPGTFSERSSTGPSSNPGSVGVNLGNEFLDA